MSWRRTYSAMVLMTLPAVLMLAGPRTVGAVFSPQRSGIEYGDSFNDAAFWNIGLGVEYGNAVFWRDRTPGVSVVFQYNYVLKTWSSSSGSGTFFAGPGLKLGYMSDKNVDPGIVAGVAGIIGMDFAFRIPVTLSLSIKPVLGLHLDIAGDNTSLRFYRNGLITEFCPEIGVKYHF